MTPDPHPFLPLGPATFHILLALAANDLHGYGILQEVARQSDGQYRLGPGTLYDNLKKLLQQNWIEETGPRSPGVDPRRRYYRLSSSGRAVFSAEVQRLEGVLREARLHLRRLDPRRT
jgi:DNA-binding PadR family transcriptional regulator